MITWFKLGLRNLLRNARRSLVTVLAIGLGFLAVNTLGGFTAYIFTSLQDSYIYGEGNGHLTVFKAGFLDKGKLDPLAFLLDADELAAVRKVLAADPDVVLASPALHISGLLSNGKVSTIFVAAGLVPEDMRSIAAHAPDPGGNGSRFDGLPLSTAKPYGIGVSRGLAQQLNLALGETAVAMAPTVAGQVNALDAQLLQVVDAPVEALEDKLAAVPLAFAQSLYDTASVDRVTVLLRGEEQTAAACVRLRAAFARAGLALEVRTWQQMAPFYTKVKKMFNVIFLVTFLIVFLIVVMSVLNTVGMAVLERTREIGTLRALGLRRAGIVRLFAIESMLLGAIGSLFGMALMLLLLYLVHLLHPTWVPPQIAREVPLRIYLVVPYWLASVSLLLALSLAAAVFPARAAARKEITHALGFA
ncbi:ABC transporter permease [Duganella aceris]|uniref:ABC transporter permease n=1 Tax=Duganella aceris TaxID=2703883 RepID=A0ABX0FL89_9BURK|nr:FtsX-like permease family protein [Duganella aceris]NGZ85362.1 ABC transporter permease [Duganella aceris]